MSAGLRLAVVGNPANRRVAMFLEAARAGGLADPQVFAWSDVLSSGPVPGPGTLVRIDSPGEDARVDRLLRGLGAGGPVREAAHGEILGLADAHAGLRVGLERIAAGGGTLLNPVRDVLVMGDKRRTHALLASRSVPVPPALAPVHDWDGLRSHMRDAGWSRVFVKPAFGSSASGVLALNLSGTRVSAVTSVERTPDGRLFNNLRVRRCTSPAEVGAIVDRLAPDGLHVERWFPKASLAGRVLDLRVVVTAGRPRHIVVRTSAHAITNLHLGNARGDLGAVRAAAGTTAWEEAMRTCERVAACFPGSLHVGVDLMFAPSWRRHAVAEVNAFGDLLPRVLADGRDTYGDQIEALKKKELACAI
ncbi:STM4014 family protein [Kineosporia sp. J2-2]|uniref:STM4014 family protein n=1 Tax=Kineosporia corallincola TaxID=2835133 RepID=A0ABS5TQU6_9ACTN|nr:STM4014 family protein [Kineosporia corallincola]MBT0772811.1 STM4014 family protein [Kineosporia corallincola]